MNPPDSPAQDSGTPKGGIAWPLFASALTALAGALWAALHGVGCTACGEAGALTAGFPLAWGGVVFYAFLTGASTYPALARAVKSAFFAAAGIHLLLLATLAWMHIACLACILTGAAAITGALLGLAARPRNLGRAALMFGAGLAAAVGGAVVLDHWQQQHAEQNIQTPLAEALATPIQPGHVRLLIFERGACPYCAQLESQMITRLVAELGAALEIERRTADESMQSPTVVVIGKGHQVFSGLPEFEELHQAVIDMRAE